MNESEYKTMIAYPKDDRRSPTIRIELEWLGSKFTQVVVQEFDTVRAKLAPAIAQAVAEFDIEASAQRHVKNLTDEAVGGLVQKIVDDILYEKRNEVRDMVLERMKKKPNKKGNHK